MGNNLFIFNFKKIPLIFILFLAVYIVGELLIYKASFILIKQMRNLEAFRSATKDAMMDVVAIGNSAVETDIDPHLLAKLLTRKENRAIKCFNLGVGDLSLGVEYLMIKNIIIPQKPSVIILGFWNEQLSGVDIQSFDTYHTFSEYMRFNDLPVLFYISSLSFNEKVDIILRKLSYTYSYRYIIRVGIDLLVEKMISHKGLPIDFIRSRVSKVGKVQTMNGFRPMLKKEDVLQTSIPSNFRTKKIVKSPHEFAYIERIRKICQDNGVRLILVALPKENEYKVPLSTQRYIKENNLIYLDLSASHTYDKYFYDYGHLNYEGAEVLTTDLVEFLASQPKTP